MKKKMYLATLFILLVVAMIAIILSASFSYTKNLMTHEEAFSIIDGWNCNWDGSTEITNRSIPGVVKGGYVNKYLHISNTLPAKAFKNACLFIRTSEQYAKIFLDGTLIYEYNQDDARQSPGSMYHFIDLPNYYIGGNLDIYLMSPYSQYAGVVNEVRIGSSISHVLYILNKGSLELVISVTIIFTGIILFFFFIAMLLLKSKHSNILYLGLFCILSGLWMATESRSLGLFIQNPGLITSLAFIGQYLAPIPIFAFIIKTYRPKHIDVIKAFIILFTVYFIIVVILHYLNITPLIDTLVLFHILLIACIAIFSVIARQEIKAGNKSIKLFFTGCILLGAFVGIDVIKFYFSAIPWLSSNAFYQYGVIIFIIITITSLAQNLFIRRDEQISHEILLSLAYSDPLTGLKNRTSFDERITALNTSLDTYSSIHLVILDINGLKMVNDKLGHKEGDRLIIDGARLINETLGRLGELYRIGGDEFAVILTDMEPYFIHIEIESLDKMIHSYNQEKSCYNISIAYGLDTFNKGHDKDLNIVFIRADKAMYICKENQKGLQKSNASKGITDVV